jgi:hypothetical protein
VRLAFGLTAGASITPRALEARRSRAGARHRTALKAADAGKRGNASAAERQMRSTEHATRKEHAMKLTSTGIDQTLKQFDAEAIPDAHPVARQLNGLFGDHTFFLDRNGLNIVEPAAAESGDVEAGRVIKLAAWVDENRTSLAPHQRELTDIVIVLGQAA